MIEPVNTYVALLDTCVLAPMPLCHTLLNLAEEPALYIPKWSGHIIQELSRTLKKFRYGDAQIARRITAMNQAFEDAVVCGYEDLIPVMRNDEKDRHVLAAAVRAGAHVIVTSNLKHFPPRCVEQYNLIVASPDDFLCNQFQLEPRIVLEAVERQASDIHGKLENLLRKLEKSVPAFADLIRQSATL
jgi:hypothetical protein